MSKQANKKAIGAFVVVALALAVAAIVVFGSGKFFEKRDYYVAYFQGSVKGLKIGAPVVFRGVAIGQVTKMAIYADRKNLSYQIPVVLQVDRDSFRSIGPDIKDRKKYFQDLIKSGLRAQLQLQSLVTGQLMVNIDFFPNTPIRLIGGKVGSIPEDMVEIPTIQTPLQKIQKTIEDLPIGDIAQSVEKSLRGIENLVASKNLSKSLDYFEQALIDISRLAQHVDAKIDPLSENVDQTLKDAQMLIGSIEKQVAPLATSVRQTSDTAGAAFKDARKLLNNVDRQVQPLAANFNRTLKQAYGALKKAEETLGTVNGAISEGAPLRYQVETTVGELSQAARSIRVLAEYLERNPDALLRGKSPTGAY
jgi:paraquat-inducible protein B